MLAELRSFPGADDETRKKEGEELIESANDVLAGLNRLMPLFDTVLVATYICFEPRSAHTSFFGYVTRRHVRIDTSQETRLYMSNILPRSFTAFLKDEDGPTAVEYAVMLALIIIVCIVSITLLGNNAKTTYTTVGTKISAS